MSGISTKVRKPCASCGGAKGPGRARRYCDPCALRAPGMKADRRRSGRRWAELRRRYGVSDVEYMETYERQGGLCAICRMPCGTSQDLCVDHDHVTGENRGLLCRRCNAALGYIENDEWMRAAFAYLGDPPGVRCGSLLDAAHEDADTIEVSA